MKLKSFLETKYLIDWIRTLLTTHFNEISSDVLAYDKATIEFVHFPMKERGQMSYQFDEIKAFAKISVD